MKFFNYLFYRLYWWNSKIVSDSMPVFSAILGLSTFQALNIVFLLELFAIANFSFAETILRNYLVIVGILAFLFNSLYYLRHKLYKSLLEDYKKTDKKEKKKMDYICICYIVVTFLLVILTIINGRINFI